VLEKMSQDLVDQGGSHFLERKIGDILATMACHSSVRAGQSLSLEEMRALLQQMDEFPLSSFCPHGRPVSVEYPFHRLEKDFGRIV
jgi:DNA mismatch repair protein MutL